MRILITYLYFSPDAPIATLYSKCTSDTKITAQKGFLPQPLDHMQLVPTTEPQCGGHQQNSRNYHSCFCITLFERLLEKHSLRVSWYMTRVIRACQRDRMPPAIPSKSFIVTPGYYACLSYSLFPDRHGKATYNRSVSTVNIPFLSLTDSMFVDKNISGAFLQEKKRCRY